jgi:hypothetical protein
MKKMIRNSLLLAGVAGFFSLANQLGAASDAAPACNMGSCCGGAVTETVADAKAKPYPLDTCIVSGEKLGEMGKPFVFVYKDQEIKLCCKSCKKDFDKDPEKFLKKLAAPKK